MARSSPSSEPWMSLPQPEQAALQARSNWWSIARPAQFTPTGNWSTWLILAGRGWGKTRTGAEDLAWYGLTHPNSRLAVVAPTYSDARDTCVEGESGLLSIIPHECLTAWNRSLGEIALWNGCRIKLFSAEEPDRLRGPQHHRAWCDELAAWAYPETWDQLLFGLRLGDSPRVVATTTPKPTPLVRELARDPSTIVTRGATRDNAANLAPAALAKLYSRYEGTRLGRQELEGEILEDVEGALWRRDMIAHEDRYRGVPRLEIGPGVRRIAWANGSSTDLLRVVVAVDPPTSNTENSAECGIIIAGLGLDGRGYVLGDRSGRKSPMEWAMTAVAAFDEFGADLVVAEGNQGGEMVRHTILTARPNTPVDIVHASRSKQARAEPVSSLYEQGQVIHVGHFIELEDQMCHWEPMTGAPSPDRLDALVWSMTSLLVGSGGLVFPWDEATFVVPALTRAGATP